MSKSLRLSLRTQAFLLRADAAGLIVFIEQPWEGTCHHVCLKRGLVKFASEARRPGTCMLASKNVRLTPTGETVRKSLMAKTVTP